MRILLAIVVLAGLAWSGFWLWNASLRERALTGWLEERRAAGWVAEGQVKVTGFPNRVDTIITGLELSNPGAGWSWGAPEFQLLSQTWRPQQLIAVWPGRQSVATPFDTLQVTSDRLVASLLLEPNSRLGLDHSTLEARNLGLTGSSGWQARFGEVLFSARKAEGDAAPFSYQVDFSAKALQLPKGRLTAIDQAGAMPQMIDRAHVAATLTFDQPWDRPAIEGDDPALQRIEVSRADFAWGKLELTAKGALGVDPRGYATGKLDLSARNWQAMLEGAEKAGLVAPGVASALRGALGLLAGLSGDRGNLSLPLTFEDGQTRLGPVPIGPAPKLAARS